MIRRFALAVALCAILSVAATAQPTIVVDKRVDIGDAQIIVATVTMDSSYAFGGEVLTAADLGFRVGSDIFQLEATVTSVGFGGSSVQWVPNATRSDRGTLRVLSPMFRQDLALSIGAMAIGSDTAQVAIGQPFSFVINGTLAEVAAADVAFTATTHDIAANADTAQEAFYLYTTDDAGSVTVTKGTTADTGSAVPPAPPANEAVFGYVNIVVAAGATPFNATSDALTAAHLTVTFRDAEHEVIQGTDLTNLTLRIVAVGR